MDTINTKSEKNRSTISDIKYLEIKKKLSDAFRLFDKDNKNFVDIR